MCNYWSEEHGKLYNRLFRFIISKWDTSNEKPTINNYVKTLPLNMLIHTIQNNDKWGNCYKSSYYFMIVRWLEINDENSEHIEFIKTIANHNKYKKYENISMIT